MSSIGNRGFDREGHPVCYNAYGVFRDKEMYERIFGDEEKLKKFLRWRVQVLERGINLLHFKPGGVNSLIQVTDLKDMPKRELRVASNQILSLFQDNYPEMVAKKIFVNVPWFVRPEDIPVQYGGLSRPSDLQNGPPKPTSEFTVKGGEKVNIQIEGIEAGATISWDIVVGGWELEYCAEFVPCAEGSYFITVEKARKVAPSEEAIHNSFTSREEAILGNLGTPIGGKEAKRLIDFLLHNLKFFLQLQSALEVEDEIFLRLDGVLGYQKMLTKIMV